ncbi:hypothetical protein G7077_04880 [Sphingomonas piscis]|uniref:Outer membrane assembly lipoprotein YfiO n=1 Tax=Sphingomonas piscis TaxID=2714943 RepID=A0A6G7YNL1_9SPHN|nr:hypothetical protein G7077_04880 [Sphingomonas piscis]
MAVAGALAGAIAFACAGGNDAPTWSLAKAEYDRYGNSAVLVPGNDTRTNLLLLLADGGQPLTLSQTDDGQAPFFSWADLRDGVSPPGEYANESAGPSRCQSNTQGTEDFVAAVRGAKGLAPGEATALIAARQAFTPHCAEKIAGPGFPPVRSVMGREFAAYLDAAENFYGGDFDAATHGFASLTSATDPWVRETATYMVPRTAINKAVIAGIDEYGWMEPDKVDGAAARAAGAGFRSYLQTYPRGRYAESARGLMRRVHWLSGDKAALGQELGFLLGRTADPDERIEVIQETDNRLFEGGAGTPSDPLLLAVADLQRMRIGGPISQAELERQRPFFAGHEALFDYLRAARALFVRNAPRDVLQIIPDRAKQPRFSTVQFSRQMLRGFALAALKDRNTRGFLLDLLPGAKGMYQRDAVELALAMNDERTGNLASVFAPGSAVRNASVREILLSRTAGPDLLRRQATTAPTIREKQAALYVLLAKELGRGMYADWLRDVQRVPAGATTEGYYQAPELGAGYDATAVPLGMFVRPASLGEYGCAPLIQTVGALAQRPSSSRDRLCLAEFMREQGFDWWEYDRPLEPGSLAGTKSLFPGQPYSRLEVYKAVMNDPAASADDKAFALYRAVRCYAPSGSNSCGGTEVSVATRKAWHDRLKASYPQSTWAKSLRYYW